MAFLHARFAQRVRVAEKLPGGILGGLVAITASCHLVSPAAAMAIGAIAGVLHNIVFELLLRRRIDDPVGAIPVHLACGIFGVTAVALFAPAEAFEHGRLAQLGVQLAGAATCLAWAGTASYALFRTLRATVGLRVSPAEERAGLALEPFEELEREDDGLDGDTLREMMGLGSG